MTYRKRCSSITSNALLHSTVLIRHGTHLTTKAGMCSSQGNITLALLNNSSQLLMLLHPFLVRFHLVKGSPPVSAMSRLRSLSYSIHPTKSTQHVQKMDYSMYTKCIKEDTLLVDLSRTVASIQSLMMFCTQTGCKSACSLPAANRLSVG